MSKTRADAFNSLLIPLIVIAPLAATYNLGVYEVYALYTYTIVATLMHINYGIHAVGVTTSTIYSVQFMLSTNRHKLSHTCSTMSQLSWFGRSVGWLLALWRYRDIIYQIVAVNLGLHIMSGGNDSDWESGFGSEREG